MCCSVITFMMTAAEADYKSVGVGTSPPMRHRGLWRVLGLGVVAAGAYAVWRAIDINRAARDTGWEAQPFPFPPGSRLESAAAGSSPLAK